MEITSQILDCVSVINRSSLNIEDEISVGKHPNWIDFTQGGKYVWVRNTHLMMYLSLISKRKKLLKQFLSVKNPNE